MYLNMEKILSSQLTYSKKLGAVALIWAQDGVDNQTSNSNLTFLVIQYGMERDAVHRPGLMLIIFGYMSHGTPPAESYSRGQAKPTNKNGNFLMATKYPEN